MNRETLRKFRLPLLVLLISALATAGAGASYIMTSSPFNLTYVPDATLSLAGNSTTFRTGDSVVLTATCSDTSYNGVVTFYEGVAIVGSATAVSGVASITILPSSVSHTYTAQGSHN